MARFKVGGESVEVTFEMSLTNYRKLREVKEEVGYHTDDFLNKCVERGLKERATESFQEANR